MVTVFLSETLELVVLAIMVKFDAKDMHTIKLQRFLTNENV